MIWGAIALLFIGISISHVFTFQINRTGTSALHDTDEHLIDLERRVDKIEKSHLINE